MTPTWLAKFKNSGQWCVKMWSRCIGSAVALLMIIFLGEDMKALSPFASRDIQELQIAICFNVLLLLGFLFKCADCLIISWLSYYFIEIITTCVNYFLYRRIDWILGAPKILSSLVFSNKEDHPIFRLFNSLNIVFVIITLQFFMNLDTKINKPRINNTLVIPRSAIDALVTRGIPPPTYAEAQRRSLVYRV